MRYPFTFPLQNVIGCVTGDRTDNQQQRENVKMFLTRLNKIFCEDAPIETAGIYPIYYTSKDRKKNTTRPIDFIRNCTICARYFGDIIYKTVKFWQKPPPVVVPTVFVCVCLCMWACVCISYSGSNNASVRKVGTGTHTNQTWRFVTASKIIHRMIQFAWSPHQTTTRRQYWLIKTKQVTFHSTNFVKIIFKKNK